MNVRLAFLSVTLTAIIAPYAGADQCNEILRRNGAFNSVIRTTASSADEQIFEWLKTATWTEFKRKQDAGLKILLPVEGVPIGVEGSYTEDDFRRFTELRDQGRIRFFSQQEFAHSVELTASPTIAAAWLQCIKDTAGRGLVCSIPTDDRKEDGTLVFRAKYHPDFEGAREPTVRGFTVVNGTVVDVPNPMRRNQKISFGGSNATIQRQGRRPVTVTLRTNRGDCEPQVATEIVDVPATPTLKIATFPVVSGSAAHPIVTAPVRPGYKLIGGGALANWRGPGSLLIASYPSNNSWVAQSKDHAGLGEATTITAWAIGLYDPQDLWEVKVESASVPYPSYARQTVTATLPPGYTMTGGGAATVPEEPGILLTASYPSSARSWTANAQDHSVAASGQLTAYVIGIRPRQGVPPEGRIFSQTGGTQPHPSAAVEIPSDYLLTGGGAQTSCPAAGNLLTASYPYSLTIWRGEAKDHIVSCPSSIVVYAIGLKPPPGSEVGFDGSVASFTNPSFAGLVAFIGADDIAPRVEAIAPGRPLQRYFVRPGDTLRSLATRYYDNADWRRIFEANRGVLRDPKLLPPGAVLTIPR